MNRKATIQAPLEQIGHIRVIDAPHRHRIDLHRRQAGVGGGLEARHHVTEAVTTSQASEMIGIDRVQTDVDPIQAGRC